MSLRGRVRTVVDTVKMLEFLMVTNGETQFAVQADAVRAVVTPEEGDVDAVLASFGITDAPVHLAERFGLTGSYLSPESKVLVCGMQGTYTATRVDRVLGLHDLESTKIKPLLPHFSGPERRWIDGMFLFQQTVVLVIHTGWLLSNDRGAHASLSGQRQSTPDLPSSGPSRLSGIEMAPARRSGHDWNTMEFEEVTDADDTPWAQI